MTDRRAHAACRRAAKNAYAPYSRFRWVRRWNATTAASTPAATLRTPRWACTICAERVAVARRYPKDTRFRRIAVWGEGNDYCMPCGTCRQVLSEFSPEMEVLCAKAGGRYVSYKLSQLLPYRFKL